MEDLHASLGAPLVSKVALVTGASRGIGRAIAVALARAGCDVALNYRDREQDAESAAHEIRAGGRRALAIRADVSQSTQVHESVRAIQQRLGPIDILVNNAGIARVQRIEEIREEDWNETLAVNLTSCFLVTQAALPGMRARRWGRIVNISSVAAQAGSIVGPHYAASKAGMLGLTRAYAKSLAREGITVNAIAPALIETDMVTANPNARPDLIPVGRFGAVDEVADVVVMLAANAYITGQTINVNGGWFMS
jgi:3-oxoacyl-[acyl-carrier protein] reductase